MAPRPKGRAARATAQEPKFRRAIQIGLVQPRHKPDAEAQSGSPETCQKPATKVHTAHLQAHAAINAPTH